MVTSFEDLLVRQRAEEITVIIYNIFKNNKDYWFRDQIQRASISIMNNLAEWYEKRTEKDKTKYFYIAKWSCAEVRSMLHISVKLWYIAQDQYDTMSEQVVTLNKMIHAFIKKFEA